MGHKRWSPLEMSGPHGCCKPFGPCTYNGPEIDCGFQSNTFFSGDLLSPWPFQTLGAWGGGLVDLGSVPRFAREEATSNGVTVTGTVA